MVVQSGHNKQAEQQTILRGVSFTDSDNGTVVGGTGTILRTTNGGVSFVEEEEIDEIPTDYT